MRSRYGGINFLPGYRIYKASGPRSFIYNTLPICRMSINGESPDAASCQWTAYEARRRATVEAIEIVSVTRLASEANAIFALLEPKKMKEQIKFFLEQDPHKNADLGFGNHRPALPDKLLVADGWDMHGHAANGAVIQRGECLDDAIARDNSGEHSECRGGSTFTLPGR